MSKYTTEVRYICEVAAGLSESFGYTSVNEVVEKAAPKIFDFSFPIFDEAYLPGLEQRILKAYYTREICEETVALWKLRLENRLNLIMPRYNKLYESERLKFEPLYDVDYTRSGTNENEGSNSANSSTTDLYSDTPQNGLQDVKEGNYLTTADVVEGESSGSNKSNGKYEEKISGKMGTTSYSRLLKEYRETFLNIDQMLINDLKDLFFGLW